MQRTSVFFSCALAPLLAGFGACKSEAPAPTETAAPLKPTAPAVPPVVEKGAQSPTVHAHMAEHYARANVMKQSVISGDLAAYRNAAAWLAEHELSATAPDAWKQHAGAMQDAAKSGRDAADIEAAAAALGRVGAACAACHKELGRPELSAGEPPAEGSGAQLHMARHQWAADRLWDGLMAPSDALWIKGAEVMTDAPLEPAVIAQEQSVAPRVVELATSVHAQAQAARGLPEAERGAAYGRFVSSCSSCHEALRVQVK